MDYHKECEELHGKEFSEGFYTNFVEAKLEYTEEKLKEAEVYNKRLERLAKMHEDARVEHYEKLQEAEAHNKRLVKENKNVTEKLYEAQQRWDEMHKTMITSHQEAEGVKYILRQIKTLLNDAKPTGG